ncbi:MAG TPA: PPC domain-containing DNA-binding protein [Candidatus Deferrimicrobium sp.]|nr:PPC domain-containing DNA-binding protein [Candidatus Deferrimicrobium sp.]
MKICETGIDRMFIIKLEPKDDILESLTLAAKENSIKNGFFTAIGAIDHAKIGYYQLDQKTYKPITLDGDFEVVSCIGNITLKDNSPLIHAHLVIADKDGHAFGGHLLSGCLVSVTCEIFLLEAKSQIIRKLDDKFQLSLISLD